MNEPPESGAHHPPANWAARSVAAGFLGTLLMLFVAVVAYFLSAWLHTMAQGLQLDVLGGWFYQLTNNAIIRLTEASRALAVAGHFLMGLGLAGVYGYFVEYRLPGAGWWRGVVFSLFPWIFSVAVFFPAVGAGFLGLGIQAGPLPVLGNLILHLVYGASLGWFYEALGERFLEEPSQAGAQEVESRALHGTSRGAALGLMWGLLLGFVASVVAMRVGGRALVEGTGLPIAWIFIALMVLGGGLGFLIGFWSGLPASKA